MFYITVSFKFIKFSFQIVLRFVVENSTNFAPYIAQILYTALVWFLSQLYFSWLNTFAASYLNTQGA